MNQTYCITFKTEYGVYTSLYALQGDTESLFKYMRALASQELNPMIIPPDILKTILHKIEIDIESHARLKLCEDPDTNIWSYYRTIKLTPIVLEDYLMLILTVPLVDQSMHMNLYKVYNLPIIHLTLYIHAQYEIEGSFLATIMDGMFITLPTALFLFGYHNGWYVYHITNCLGCKTMFDDKWTFMHV